jgi:hypothetical protein
LLLQALFSVRSERQFMQQITYNMLFRWFVGLAMDTPVWDVTVFTKNHYRLMEGDIARGFLAAILADGHVKPPLSSEHFSVDGTLIEAWASMKSFRPCDGSGEPPAPGRNGERDFHGDKRSNETHATTTDPDARLFRKSAGQPSQLCHMGHLLMESRNGLVVVTALTKATGTAERDSAAAMLGARAASGHHGGRGQAVRHQGFVVEMRRLGVTPQSPSTPMAAAPQSTAARHATPAARSAGGYASALRRDSVGIKTVGGLRKTRRRGTARHGSDGCSR